jgi:hypothetical protein
MFGKGAFAAILACGAMCFSSFEAQAEARSGTLIYDITINIKSKIDPANGTASPQCGVYVFHWGSGAASYTEYGYVVSSRNSSTATCKIKIPYSWANASPASLVSSKVYVFLGSEDVPSKSPSPVIRRSNHGLPDIALPANGTTKNFAVTLDF